MIKKPTPENNKEPSLGEKILARFYREIDNKGSGDTKHLESITQQAESKETALPFNFGRPSILEMWNIIESIGIKRQSLDKIFTTDEAVSELYQIIEKRIHYNREQEMIRRLTVYAARINKVDSGANQLYTRA